MDVVVLPIALRLFGIGPLGFGEKVGKVVVHFVVLPCVSLEKPSLLIALGFAGCGQNAVPATAILTASLWLVAEIGPLLRGRFESGHVGQSLCINFVYF